MNKRYIELDLLRTLAIVMMIIYHAAYDLQFFYGWDFDTLNGPWWVFARLTAVLFLLIVGISFSISWSRHSSKSYKKYLLRGLGVILCGMLVSLVTWLWDSETYVRFGILHLIGVSILLLPFFARLGVMNAVLGILFIAADVLLKDSLMQTSLLLPLGIVPLGFDSVDYFPLIPWFGFVLIGYVLGHVIYVRHPRAVSDRARGWFGFAHHKRALWITWPGRHALLIYLIHQPILLGIFGFLGILSIL